MFGVPEDRPGKDHLHRMGLEEETRHHPEIPAAAAQCPEQIRILPLAGRHEAAVGKHHVGLEQIVDREAVLPRQIPCAAAECQSGNAGCRNDSEGDRKAECMGGVIDVAGRATRLDAHRRGFWIYAHPFHCRKVNHQSVVAAAEARTIVAAAAYSDEQALIAAEIHRRHNIGNIGAAHDKKGPFVDHAVVKHSRFFVARVVAPDEGSMQARFKCRQFFVAHNILASVGRNRSAFPR